MSEAYECDRCGGTFTGSPHTTVEKMDGLGRSRARENREHRSSPSIKADMRDLCPGCEEDFETWFDDGGPTTMDELDEMAADLEGRFIELEAPVFGPNPPFSHKPAEKVVDEIDKTLRKYDPETPGAVSTTRLGVRHD